MKPTTTIAVLYLVVAGASAMNPSSYQQFENPDTTEPSQSTGCVCLKSMWRGLKGAFQSCGRQGKACTSSTTNLLPPENPDEETADYRNPLDEENDRENDKENDKENDERKR
ncbi:hypothetical protein BASA60_007149 [Batrachochytrium salamandrivorans]|nr:hypothetical protein BASA60_007149 [Batrachochytrium salamandrivorans]